jgi:3-hydroxybutyryl-CoA dehydrogenase
MEILVVGTDEQAEECRQKFGALHTVRRVQQVDATATTGVVASYVNIKAAALFFDTTFMRLDDLLREGNLQAPAFGFCGLRTFMNREVLEVALKSEADRATLLSTCEKLGTSFEVVADQAGMVTPRVICMIINEAYRTLEEAIASPEDIDLAMKLGTNYPWGPFEWADRIGPGNVVSVLKEAQKETGDERYEVCRLLLERSGRS